MKILTNNRPREIIYAHELSKEERKEFDYIDWEAFFAGAEFFKYKGQLYDLDEFETTSRMLGHEFEKWDGYKADTFFSGILIKYTPDYEHVIVGRYYA